MPRMFRNPYLLLTLAMMLWSGNIFLGRAMHLYFTPSSLSFWRWSAALAILLPITGRSIWSKRSAIRREWVWLFLLGILSTFLFNWLLYKALETTTATNTALLYSNTPVFIVLVSWIFLAKPLVLRQVAGIALSMVGVVAIITRGNIGLLVNLTITPGDVWALGTVPVWGIYILMLKRRPAFLSPMEFLTVLVIFGLLVTIPVYLWDQAMGGGVSWSPAAYSTIAYLAVFSSILAFLFWNEGAPQVGASVAGLFSHQYPLYAAFLEVTFLDESLQFYHLAGAILIVVGFLFATFKIKAA